MLPRDGGYLLKSELSFDPSFQRTANRAQIPEVKRRQPFFICANLSRIHWFLIPEKILKKNLTHEIKSGKLLRFFHFSRFPKETQL